MLDYLKKIIDEATEHATSRGYKNFKIVNIARLEGVFSYELDVVYDWVDEELKVNEPGYKTTWKVGLSGDKYSFVY